MKVALSTDAADLNGDLNPNFGRCRRFLILDTATGRSEAVPNPGCDATGGAGVQAARALAARGVKRVISGRVGPNARGVLENAGIEIIENRSGAMRPLVGQAACEAPLAACSANPASPRPAGGFCFCEHCGYRSRDDGGLPCFQQRCPNCGAMLERKLAR